jgi:hypothetical protein
MIYLSIVTAVVLSIMYVSYKVGRAVGEANGTDERHQLRTANAQLIARVDFLTACAEHRP